MYGSQRTHKNLKNLFQPRLNPQDQKTNFFQKKNKQNQRNHNTNNMGQKNFTASELEQHHNVIIAGTADSGKKLYVTFSKFLLGRSSLVSYLLFNILSFLLLLLL